MAGFGGKKTYDAVRDNKKARETRENAGELHRKATRRLKEAQRDARNELEELGRLKLELWDRHLGRFVTLFEQLRRVELEGAGRVEELGASSFDREELKAMREVASFAREVTGAGPTALGSGALVGLASYGGATMFATASTGTAIGSLSGVAATNATLAWFGGGSLAAGGMGMAGGAAVLGGIVAAPVLAVGGVVFAARARKNLAQAKMDHAAACRAAAEMAAAASLVRGIRKVATRTRKLLQKMAIRFETILDLLEAVIESDGTDYQAMGEKARQRVYVAVQFASCLKTVVEAPLLTKSGALAVRHGKVLSAGKTMLTKLDS
jgi:hypothetical protein